jgi:hypothetical protein
MDDFKTELTKQSFRTNEKEVPSVLENVDLKSAKERDEIDLKMGFVQLQPGINKLGWLVNIQEV